jgi:hypothetical protein
MFRRSAQRSGLDYYGSEGWGFDSPPGALGLRRRTGTPRRVGPDGSPDTAPSIRTRCLVERSRHQRDDEAESRDAARAASSSPHQVDRSARRRPRHPRAGILPTTSTRRASRYDPTTSAYGSPGLYSPSPYPSWNVDISVSEASGTISPVGERQQDHRGRSRKRTVILVRSWA